MKKILLTTAAIAAGAFCFAAAATPASAAAGFIALEGSDATTFHQDPVYTPQLFKYLQGGSSKDVLVYRPGGGPNPGPTGGVGETFVGSLTGVTLSDYSALYVESGGGCCSANPTALDGFGAAVNAFVAGGGNVSIENYLGGGYDGVVPGGAGASVAGGQVRGTDCKDTEVVTANGASKGFGQPPVDFCWSHQSYENSYFSTFGYVDLIHNTGYAAFGDGTTNGSSFLATGGTLGTSGTPEPATWAMMLIGFGGMGAVLRSSRRRTAVTTA